MTPDGFFRTGDIGIMDETGRTRIVDRKKDMITVSGSKVYPNEVEAVVSSHPGVLECGVIGIPDPRSGNAVKLFVVKKDPNLTEAALIAYCQTRLTSYTVPRLVEFRTELPKDQCRQDLASAVARRVAEDRHSGHVKRIAASVSWRSNAMDTSTAARAVSRKLLQEKRGQITWTGTVLVPSAWMIWHRYRVLIQNFREKGQLELPSNDSDIRSPLVYI